MGKERRVIPPFYGALFVILLLLFFRKILSYFMFLVFLFSSFMKKKKHFFKRCLHALWELRFHVLGGIVFLAAYFLFRASCAGSSYSGNTPNFSQPLNSLIVLFTFLTGLFPGTTFYHLRNALPDLNLLAFIDWKNVVIILISTIFVCYLLYKMPRFPCQFLWPFSLLSTLFWPVCFIRFHSSIWIG